MANFFTHKTDHPVNLDQINERAAHYEASQKAYREVCKETKHAEALLLKLEAHVVKLKEKLASTSGKKKQSLEQRIQRNEQTIVMAHEKLDGFQVRREELRKGLENLEPLLLVSQLGSVQITVSSLKN